MNQLITILYILDALIVPFKHLIILKLCQQVSYYSRIVFVDSFTYIIISAQAYWNNRPLWIFFFHWISLTLINLSINIFKTVQLTDYSIKIINNVTVLYNKRINWRAILYYRWKIWQKCMCQFIEGKLKQPNRQAQ